MSKANISDYDVENWWINKEGTDKNLFNYLDEIVI